MATTIEITEVSSNLTVTGNASPAITVTEIQNNVLVNESLFTIQTSSAAFPVSISVDSLATGIPGPKGDAGIPGATGATGPSGDVTTSNITIAGTTVTVETAINELYNRFFQQATAPIDNVNPGDLWYNTTTNIMNVREGLSWIPMVVTPDLTTTSLDGGYF